MMRTMRIHLFDPQLGANSGHYLGYDSAIIDELHRRKTPCFIYGAASQDPSMSTSYRIERVFARDIFAETGRDPATWALENFDTLNADFSRDLASIDSDRFDCSDLAFFPNITQNQIAGVRHWILSLPAARRPMLVLKPSYLTHLMPYMQNRPNKDLTMLLFRFAIRRLVGEYSRVAICTDTEELAEAIKQISGTPVFLLPLPLSIDEPRATKEPSNRLCCAYLGHASPLKGFHFLPNLIAAFQHSRPAARFLVQSYGDENLRSPIEKALRALSGASLSLVEGALTRLEYLGLLHDADIVIMPYAREFYGWASSGIFVEAVSLAKVVLVPEDTWAARQGARFDAGCVTFQDWTPEAVAKSLQAALEAFPLLSEKARAAAAAWRDLHSPRNFVDQLFGVSHGLRAGAPETVQSGPV
jgi:glycosyltransferase involved in cell wall biosynthesis